ncbi:putative transmembrane anti-sigma factor [Pseudogulbenkiania sp. NH8B]|uniref:anti-sigma factor family protein n=1 Tax=Pseudogulbenkiania sp. (strain NH8B) TaxID=748280 RepID=UPI0002279A4B|nr:anti-sigma factor [Pseudogulbenkiania sp. NH8B]BAK76842.1 putative transmembrane anti-sigma factor [Pseudogulbenkiania sp. NH8B]
MNEPRDTTANTPDSADELRPLSALVDGELSDAERSALLERLGHDPAAAARVAHYRSQNAALRRLFPLAGETASLFVQRRTPWWQLGAAITGGLALGLMLAIMLPAQLLPGGFGQPAFAQRADLAYAVYAPERRHPVEVTVREEAHLLSWLSARLKRAVTAPSLGEYGYALVGGRLLPGESGPAAQFMYQNSTGKRLTLYISPYPSREISLRLLHNGASRTAYWANHGMGYALSGTDNEPRLRAIAADACTALGGDAGAWSG